jgi:hypothetical protein
MVLLTLPVKSERLICQLVSCFPLPGITKIFLLLVLGFPYGVLVDLFGFGLTFHILLFVC